MPGLHLERLSDTELNRLHDTMMAPQYYLIEKPAIHRRYSQSQSALVVRSLLAALDPRTLTRDNKLSQARGYNVH